mmetsp:Transcript_22570/g.36288  ORF Transcript_22570/g.36288 Transcript_22570/m.36288 type:complete len:210 (-) Transcript_22570:702-1331(-)
MGVCSSDSSENIFYKNQFRDYKVLFTKEQLTEIFEKYDHDDNETLQLSEIESMIKDMLDAVLHKQISYLSGKANVRPLLKKFKKRIQDAKGNYKRHALRLQNAIDQDRDGKITKPEFTDFILNLQANRREGILGVIAAGDDGSLILTKKQYIKKKKKVVNTFLIEKQIFLFHVSNQYSGDLCYHCSYFFKSSFQDYPSFCMKLMVISGR